jgi:hypothetical protein
VPKHAGSILPAREHNLVMHSFLSDAGRDVPHGEPNPRVGLLVRIRPVYRVQVVERHLSGSEAHVHRQPLIHWE